ncbi:aspartyl/asparaginyl beta-hydroxylase domain-containing protein [Piscinibacter sp. SJAQ100]|uniref:Aspartyl/asparaginyl beta-hydroxylase domain-containing protein n=1 Tax=Aquariibacter albus TaxID=2759899 RepID=A0A839HN07_9BURK|nr:aspartyl/asparaginyl beta-hydroxylase domain-containing protein [Aquariibacter albus]MBB1160978.1 aspartyl/asparaginyl beta-hydroxylase domain-containing protein [Aquariibacter albus]
MALRHAILLSFLASALYIHLRGRVRFPLKRALDFTIVLAPVNALMYLFSRVPAQPFLDPADFPQLQPLQANWQRIRDEALALDGAGRIRASEGYTDVGFNSFFRTGWTRFHLLWYGRKLDSAARACPQTVALLRQIPGLKAAMFASLPPGATLVRHRDPYAGSLRYHLGLCTPNDPGCFIEVDGERRHWRDGEAMMFDETFIHHAANTTQQPRIVLFCDVERPLHFGPVRAFNRWFAGTVMAAAASQNEGGDASLGGLNRVFGAIYRLRLKAKALKVRSRGSYYTGKWLLIAGLLWLLFA